MNRFSIKKLFVKTLQYSQESTCVGDLFLMKMQAFSPVTLLKRGSITGVNIAKETPTHFLLILRNS